MTSGELVAVLWSVVVLLVAVLIGRERSRKNRRMFDPAPMPGEAAAEPEPEATDQADIIAHQRGWCGCEPYDQDAALTDDDLDWLSSQGGAS